LLAAPSCPTIALSVAERATAEASATAGDLAEHIIWGLLWPEVIR
jgi:hypothetical protein